MQASKRYLAHLLAISVVVSTIVVGALNPFHETPKTKAATESQEYPFLRIHQYDYRSDKLQFTEGLPGSVTLQTMQFGEPFNLNSYFSGSVSGLRNHVDNLDADTFAVSLGGVLEVDSNLNLTHPNATGSFGLNPIIKTINSTNILASSLSINTGPSPDQEYMNAQVWGEDAVTYAPDVYFTAGSAQGFGMTYNCSFSGCGTLMSLRDIAVLDNDHFMVVSDSTGAVQVGKINYGATPDLTTFDFSAPFNQAGSFYMQNPRITVLNSSATDADFVLMYNDTANKLLQAVVGHIDYDDTIVSFPYTETQVTFGTPINLETDVVNSEAADMVTIDGTHVLMGYYADYDTVGGIDSGYVRIATITLDSGTPANSTLSLGTSAAFNTGALYLDIDLLSSTKFVAGYSNNNSQKGTLALGNISGTNVTWDSSVIFSEEETYGVGVTALDTDRIGLVYYKGGNSYAQAVNVHSVSSNVSIQPIAGVFHRGLEAWDTFTEDATKPSNTGIYYQLSSDDGLTWKYWNAGTSNWVTDSDPDEGVTESDYNTASVINSNISSFDTSTGELLFRAFLVTTDNVNLPILNRVEIGHTAQEVIKITDSSYTNEYINFNPGDTLYVEVNDLKSEGLGSLALEAVNTANGDTEAFTLAETSVGSAKFRGSLPSASGSANSGDGIMQGATLNNIEISAILPTDGTVFMDFESLSNIDDFIFNGFTSNTKPFTQYYGEASLETDNTKYIKLTNAGDEGHGAFIYGHPLKHELPSVFNFKDGGLKMRLRINNKSLLSATGFSFFAQFQNMMIYLNDPGSNLLFNAHTVTLTPADITNGVFMDIDLRQTDFTNADTLVWNYISEFYFVAATGDGTTGNPGLEFSIDDIRMGDAVYTDSTIQADGVRFMNATYSTVASEIDPGNSAYVELTKVSEAGNGTINVSITTSSGDGETVALSEVGSSSGIFRGSIPTANSTPTGGNGILEGEYGDTLSMSSGVLGTYVGDFSNLTTADLGGFGSWTVFGVSNTPSIGRAISMPGGRNLIPDGDGRFMEMFIPNGMQIDEDGSGSTPGTAADFCVNEDTEFALLTLGTNINIPTNGGTFTATITALTPNSANCDDPTDAEIQTNDPLGYSVTHGAWITHQSNGSTANKEGVIIYYIPSLFSTPFDLLNKTLNFSIWIDDPNNLGGPDTTPPVEFPWQSTKNVTLLLFNMSGGSPSSAVGKELTPGDFTAGQWNHFSFENSDFDLTPIGISFDYTQVGFALAVGTGNGTSGNEMILGLDDVYTVDAPTTATFTTPSGPLPVTTAGLHFTDSSYISLDDLGTDVSLGSPIYFRLNESGSAGAGTKDIQILSALGDTETITLTETGVSTGRFQGNISTANSTAKTDENGTLEAINGNILTAAVIVPGAPGSTSVVDDFGTYGDTAAMQAAWVDQSTNNGHVLIDTGTNKYLQDSIAPNPIGTAYQRIFFAPNLAMSNKTLEFDLYISDPDKLDPTGNNFGGAAPGVISDFGIAVFTDSGAKFGIYTIPRESLEVGNNSISIPQSSFSAWGALPAISNWDGVQALIFAPITGNGTDSQIGIGETLDIRIDNIQLVTSASPSSFGTSDTANAVGAVLSSGGGSSSVPTACTLPSPVEALQATVISQSTRDIVDLEWNLPLRNRPDSLRVYRYEGTHTSFNENLWMNISSGTGLSSGTALRFTDDTPSLFSDRTYTYAVVGNNGCGNSEALLDTVTLPKIVPAGTTFDLDLDITVKTKQIRDDGFTEQIKNLLEEAKTQAQIQKNLSSKRSGGLSAQLIQDANAATLWDASLINTTTCQGAKDLLAKLSPAQVPTDPLLFSQSYRAHIDALIRKEFFCLVEAERKQVDLQVLHDQIFFIREAGFQYLNESQKRLISPTPNWGTIDSVLKLYYYNDEDRIRTLVDKATELYSATQSALTSIKEESILSTINTTEINTYEDLVANETLKEALVAIPEIEKLVKGHQETFMLEIWNAGVRNTPIKTIEVTTDIFGNAKIRIPNFRVGEYDFAIKKPYVIRKYLSNITANRYSMHLDFTRGYTRERDAYLRYGDLDGNGCIDAQDLREAFSISSGKSSSGGDIIIIDQSIGDEDGIISLGDFLPIIQNWGCGN